MKWLVILALVLVLATIWLISKANNNDAAAENLMPPLGRIVTVGDQDVHIKIEGSGPPLVLIHGANGNVRDFTSALVPALIDNYTTITVDRPGLGFSSPIGNSGATLQQQGDVLSAAVKQLGYDKIYLLGQSYGGSVALNWTLEHPETVAGLILVSAPSNMWDTPLGTLYKINSNPISGPILRLFVSAFPPKKLVEDSLTEIFAPQAVTDGYRENFGAGLTLRRTSQRSNALQIAALKSQIRPMIPRYGEILVPVEAVHGDTDSVVPYDVHTELLAGQIADITQTVLPNTGHMPHHTNIPEVLTAINRLHQNVALPAATVQN